MTALPALYVVLALRASMPLVLSAGEVFSTMIVVLAMVGWPWPARGVRAVVAAERGRGYAEAARALGAGSTRILLRHLLPAARGFLVVQATLLVPAFVLAEATLSFVGLGFGEPIPSWGAMLRDAAHGRAIVDAPWLLAPAVAIVCAALAVNLFFEPAAQLRARPRTELR
jgi:peptide/nickel transport system permease protein